MDDPEPITNCVYRYRFAADLCTRDLEQSLQRAVVAAESLHGRSEVHLDASFRFDPAARTCVIDATTEIGRDIARIFTGFLAQEFGERAFRVEKVHQSVTCAKKPRPDAGHFHGSSGSQ